MNAMRLWLFVMVAVLLAGCGTANKYRVMDRKAEHPPIPLRVVVTDFEDNRPTAFRPGNTLNMIPLWPYEPYYWDRFDAASDGRTLPFRSTLAKRLADRMAEAGTFESVTYHPADKLPAPGDFDLLVRGRMDQVRAQGSVTRYGLSYFGDVLWYLGLPERNRRWMVDIELQLLNAYTNEPIGEPVQVQTKTSKRLFTIYAKKALVKDLHSKTVVVWDQFIDSLWKTQPGADDAMWAAIPVEGKRMLAEQAREAELQRKGSPPTFSFLSPLNAARVRGAEVALQWSLTAPGGLKLATLKVNGKNVDLGIDPERLLEAESAPTSLPAAEIEVPLQLGLNKIEAVVVDHRGNRVAVPYELTRLPAALVPESRRALLAGGGSATARASLDGLEAVLADPLVGQFDGGRVRKAVSDSGDAASALAAVAEFGREVKAGELALIYVALPGDATAFTVGGKPMQEFIDAIRQALATEEAIVVFDIAWSGASSGDSIESRIGKLTGVPARWAFVLTDPSGDAGAPAAGPSHFAAAAIAAMKDEDSGETLTLESLLDATAAGIEQATGGKSAPLIQGRFNQSITIVERE